MKDPITFADVLSARKNIADHIIHTPLRPSAALSDRIGSPVWLKCEQQQYTGSFKLRGAANAVLRLSDAEKAKGVVGVFHRQLWPGAGLCHTQCRSEISHLHV